MIKIMQGNIGTGKTFSALEIICDQAAWARRRVYTNIPHFDGPDYLHKFNEICAVEDYPGEIDDLICDIVVLPENSKELLDFLKSIPIKQKSLIVIDEAQIYFPRNKDNSAFVSWLSQYQCNNQPEEDQSLVYLITQDSKFLDDSIFNYTGLVITHHLLEPFQELDPPPLLIHKSSGKTH